MHPKQQAMKDVTPKSDGKTRPLTEVIRKGGHNQGASKIKDSPQAPGAVPSAKKKVGTAVAVSHPQSAREAKSVLAIIADAAANPAINPATMRELLDMQKEIMAEQSRRDFNSAFIALQAELPSIRQDGKIEIREKDPRTGSRDGGRVQQATPYATFNNIMKVIKPLLVKHGFALSFSTEPAGERLLVKGILEGHGHERTTAFPLPAETSGSKNNVQGWGSSLSYGKRYCTVALLNIVSEAPEDRDTDGHRGNFKPAKGGGFAEVPDEEEKITPHQKDALMKKIEWCGVSLSTFHGHYGIEKTADLPANLYDAAIKACDDFYANRKAKAAHG